LGLAAYLLAEHPLVGLDHLSPRARRAYFYAAEGLTAAGLVGGVLVVAAMLFWITPAFDALFQRFVRLYERSLRWAIRNRTLVLAGVLLLLVPAGLAFRHTGRELFPDVDSGEFTLHVRASGGPRVETTEKQVATIEDMIRGFQATGKQFVQEVW